VTKHHTLALYMGLVFSSLFAHSVQAQYSYTTNLDSTLTITNYTGSGGDLVVPETINGLSVSKIGDYAFYETTNLTSVALPNGVTSIGKSAFGHITSLTNIVLPAGLISIGDFTFWSCSKLATADIPSSVTTIGQYAFAFSGLTSVVIPDGVTTIRYSTFRECSSLTNAIIGSNVVSIGTAAFDGCKSLPSVILPASLTYVGPSAFSFCNNLKYVVFLGNAPTLGSSIFFTTPATVYYMPATTGWGSTFSDRPTMPWDQAAPLIHGTTDGLGVREGSFRIPVSGPPSLVVVTDASSDLIHWTPLATNVLTGSVEFINDVDWTNHPNRFYRAHTQY